MVNRISEVVLVLIVVFSFYSVVNCPCLFETKLCPGSLNFPC